MASSIGVDFRRIAAPLWATLLAVMTAADGIAGTPFANSIIPTDLAGPWGMTADDLDGDGRDDLAVTLFNTNEVLIIRGAGPNPPTTDERYPVGDRPGQ